MDNFVVAITGASGSVLAKRLIEVLSTKSIRLHVVSTNTGAQVFKYETGKTIEQFTTSLKGNAEILLHDSDCLFAPIASGSYPVSAMVIIPCSMSTAGKLAHSTGDNLVVRAADVCLKERAKLVIVPRETPMHAVHLRNLASLSELGASIVPPIPMYYDKPVNLEEVVDGIVGRIMKSMGIENSLYKNWENIYEKN